VGVLSENDKAHHARWLHRRDHGTRTHAFAIIGVTRRKTMSTEQTSFSDKARRVAVHEAGHVVCGRILGFACGGATITANGTGSAMVAGVLSLHWDLGYWPVSGPSGRF
jgi:hypothetical protein